ncbi:hypothetical protein H6P81_014174 [Aristolochia fimbriata]|uniref:Uncharacterized protein n=1 Tax=Aristolochia fimbriata TaxID=158543 RepID=A0AAV7EJJ9_ARIFI|nr:hypothetical protein H6P81_014174 [Aristolochia fimbriata]
MTFRDAAGLGAQKLFAPVSVSVAMVLEPTGEFCREDHFDYFVLALAVTAVMPHLHCTRLLPAIEAVEGYHRLGDLYRCREIELAGFCFQCRLKQTFDRKLLVVFESF